MEDREKDKEEEEEDAKAASSHHPPPHGRYLLSGYSRALPQDTADLTNGGDHVGSLQ